MPCTYMVCSHCKLNALAMYANIVSTFVTCTALQTDVDICILTCEHVHVLFSSQRTALFRQYRLNKVLFHFRMVLIMEH